jgi:NTE family protein
MVAGMACGPLNAPLNAQLPREDFPTAGGDGPGYRFQKLAHGENDDDLFVCVTFSGGGTRAAAFAYGAALALQQAVFTYHARRTSLLDEVDCISSVSGGSFTAAYFGLFHGFDHFEDRVLYRDIQGRLALKLLNPWNWLRLASPYFSRIDLAAELYDDEIFAHHSFKDLSTRGRPFVILNATNLARGIRFAFTQDQFDMIGSDLADYPVARAVAASSAFPFLLSPMTLQNYQPLPDFVTPTEYTLAATPQTYYASRSRYAWGSSQLDYMRNPHPYVHLMDGGLADNVGLRSIVNAYEQSNGFIRSRLRNIKRLAIIAVNARTESPDTIDDSRCTPHIIPTVALGTATISMDNYSFDTVDFASRLGNELRQAESDAVSAPHAAPFVAPAPYVAEISFEAIRDRAVRDAFVGIGTNFHLPRDQVRALIAMGCELMKRDPVFRCLLEDLEEDDQGRHGPSACERSESHPRAADRIVCPDGGPWPPRN